MHTPLDRATDMMPIPSGAAPAVWNVFLSSTVRDLKEYRQQIREACRQRAQTICLLSEEDWPGGYDDTVGKCMEQIQAANGFFLILGFWYGSIPPGSDRSITHIEFDTALTRWQDARPRPIAVMQPKRGSPAAGELRDAARAILKNSKLKAVTHKKLLRDFHSKVTGSWRRVEEFKNISDVRELVIARCWEFKGHTPIAAARTGSVPAHVSMVSSQVTDAQLGALGREEQLAAAKAILVTLADHPDVPAVAMIAVGDEDAGQRALLQRLSDTVLKKYSPRRDPSTLPPQWDAGLAAWITQLLGLAPGVSDTPEQVAVQVAAELKQQPLFFCIDSIGNLANGATTFREDFWVPFYQTLLDLRRRERFPHRLVAVVADYSAEFSSLDAVSSDPGSPDYTRLLRLPTLGPFTRADVLTWFDEMDVPDDAAGRRAALADRVLKHSKGLPLRVFDRLRGESLWPAGVSND